MKIRDHGVKVEVSAGVHPDQSVSAAGFAFGIPPPTDELHESTR